MRNDIYTLPELKMVSGETIPLRFRLWTDYNEPFNAENCSGNFAVINYSDKYGETIVSKTMTFSIGDNDIEAYNFASVTLESEETLGLWGQYIYQITIKDTSGKIDIPNQGLLFISHNINESFL